MLPGVWRPKETTDDRLDTLCLTCSCSSYELMRQALPDYLRAYSLEIDERTAPSPAYP
jgi:hypothetical protein